MAESSHGPDVALELTIPVDVSIRPLAASDLVGLDWDSDGVLNPHYLRRMLEDRRSEVVFLVALVRGSPVARLGVDFGRKRGARIVVLWSFAVLPALQRHGIGTALVRAAEELAAARAGPGVTLEIGVDSWNRDASRLYERLGYAPAGEEPGEDGATIQLLRRTLSRPGPARAG